MPEIFMFPVYRGFAKRKTNGGIRASIHYELVREPILKRINANPDFGLKFYSDIIEKGHVEIATKENPSRSYSAGAIYILENGRFFSNRRSKDAPTHKLQHCIQNGYPRTLRQTTHPEDVLREESAELVLVTKEKPHRLIVPDNDYITRYSSIEAAGRIGIDTSKIIKTQFHFEEGPDTLEIYDDDIRLNTVNGFLGWLWEHETSADFFQPCYIKFDPDNILPIDTEGMHKDSKYIHFNRETFLFDPREIKNKRFGDRLENPIVYKSERINEDLQPVLQKNEPPDAPYIFMPDNALSRMLYGLKIWEGDWLEHFRDFHQKIIEGEKNEL